MARTPNKASFGEKHEHIRGRGLISGAALGLSDGLVTNLAFLAGFAASIDDIGIIRYAGIAAMLAGSVSMFFGALLAARSEHDLFRADRSREASEIESEPEEERAELREFYLEKGLNEDEASMVISKVTSDKKRWLEDILIHELHVHESGLENPFRVALVTGASFLLGALVPLSSYLLISTRGTAMLGSITLSLIFLFGAGAWKGQLVGRKVWRAGLEMLLIGIVASALLYAIGKFVLFV